MISCKFEVTEMKLPENCVCRTCPLVVPAIGYSK